MSASRFADRPTFAMTWVPETALVEFAGVADPARARAEAALRLGIDYALIEPGVHARDAAEALLAVGVVPVWAIHGPASRLSMALGYTHVAKLSAQYETFPKIDMLLSSAAREVRADVNAALEAGASVVLLADELSSSAGWLLDPRFVNQRLLPVYQRMADLVKSAGAACLFHSDGDVSSLYARLSDAGFVGAHVAVEDITGTDAAFEAQYLASMTPAGGILVSDLARDARAAGCAAAARLRGRAGIICDDGGMTTVSGLRAYGQAIESAKRTLGILSDSEG